MAEEKKIDAQVRAFFHGFSDKHRMKIIELLLVEPMNVSDICRHFSMSQPSVSHHLALMKKGGLLESRRKGKEVFYSVDKDHILAMMTYYMSRFGLVVKEL